MKIDLLFRAILLAVGGGLLVSGCGDLPPLPGPRPLDGASPSAVLDSTAASSDGASESAGGDASETPAVDASGAPRPDAPTIDVPSVLVDSARDSSDGASESAGVDTSGTPAVDAPGAPRVDASSVDVPSVLICPAGYADCNGDDRDGCETAINTPEHCGSCKNACGAVANGTAACVSGKCAVKCAASYDDCDGKYENGCESALNTVSHCGSCKNACAAAANGTAVCASGKCTLKCTAPYDDCDGNYENGCEIPVGQAHACNKAGLASFSGQTPPCGTPYCGSATASNAVVNFGSWYCTFCVHCHLFGEEGYAWCLFSDGANGNFSGDRCGGKSGKPVCCKNGEIDLVCK
jgi:hypothetical protein